MEETLGLLQARIGAFAEERDWLQFHTPRNLVLALVASEGARSSMAAIWGPG